MIRASKKRIVHIISGDRWAGAEAQAYALLKQLSSDCDCHAIVLNAGLLADKLTAAGIPVTVLDEKELNAWQILMNIRRRLTELKPDVVHTHRQKENILGALANLTVGNVHSVRTVHGAPEFSGNWKTKLLRKIDHQVGLHLQQDIIVVSSDLKEQLTTQFPAEKIHVVQNGVNTADLLAAAGITDFKREHPEKIHIGIIGRLNPVKRIDLFLEAAALLSSQEFRRLHFHVIGDGPLREKLESQAISLKISEIVFFHGHRDDIPACINSLDTVVMCSDHEGMPMVALETLVLGRKLVAHNVGGLKSLALTNSMVTYSPNQPEVLRDAILQPLPLLELDNRLDIATCARETFELYQIEYNADDNRLYI